MKSTNVCNEISAMCDKVASYEVNLLKTYGALLYGNDLWKVIGYPSSNAFRQSVKRKTLPVPTFKREGYRMRFARTHDIAIWLAAMDEELQQNIEGET
jgi:hypothetical protein